MELASRLVQHIRSLDPTRPVTAALNSVRGGSAALDPGFEPLDIAGYNYLDGVYEADHARHPARVIVGTESFPPLAFEAWDQVEKHACVIGDFVWTGMDHLGESSIGNAQLGAPARQGGGAGAQAQPAKPAQAQQGGAFTWPAGGSNISLPFPWFNCYCGDIDLIGQPKPQWFFRRVLWGLSRLEMLVQRPVPAGRSEVISWWGWSDELRSWTWPGFEGRTLKVRVYSSGNEVRLLLNGRDVASKPVSRATRLTAEFEVPYAPGELRAVALANGRSVAELVLRTAGKPAGLRLTADRTTIGRSRNDLAYVTVDVVDAAGDLVPDAAVPVAIGLHGPGELAAAGTANPKDVHSFRQPRPRTFHGRCLAIVRPTGAAGSVTVQAQADGLTAGRVVLQVG